MIEKTVLEHLRRELGQVPVYMEYPDEKETTFVVIEKTGSGITNGDKIRHDCSAVAGGFFV